MRFDKPQFVLTMSCPDLVGVVGNWSAQVTLGARIDAIAMVALSVSGISILTALLSAFAMCRSRRWPGDL